MKLLKILLINALLMMSFVAKSQSSTPPLSQQEIRWLRDQAKIAIALKNEVYKRDSVIALYQQKALVEQAKVNSLQNQVTLLTSIQNNKDYLYSQETSKLKKAARPKPFGIGVGVGYGISQNLKPSPIIGVTASYNIIRF